MARAVKKSNAALVAGLLMLAGTGSAAAAAVVADARTLGATADLTAQLPAAQNFAVTAAGQVRVTLTDLATPQAFAQLKLVVSRGGTKVASLDNAGNQQFAATPGEYKVQVVGLPAPANSSSGPAGTFHVEVRELAGNTMLRQFTDGMASLPAAPTAQSGLDTSILLQAGTYQVTLSDRSFPAALSSVDLLLDPASAGGDMLAISGPCTTACTQSLTVTAPGNYDLYVVATAANPDQAGLYSLKITSTAGGAVAYGTTQPVGRPGSGHQHHARGGRTYLVCGGFRHAPCPDDTEAEVGAGRGPAGIAGYFRLSSCIHPRRRARRSCSRSHALPPVGLVCTASAWHRASSRCIAPCAPCPRASTRRSMPAGMAMRSTCRLPPTTGCACAT